MATTLDVDLEHGDGGAPRRHSDAASDGGSSVSSDRSWHSPLDSSAVHRASSFSGTEIVGVSSEKRGSSASECSVEVEVDLEADGVPQNKVHLAKSETERDCRICHLSFDATNEESGVPIELGCSCKDDLAAAHKQCAEAWFKIKGNKTCEICGSTAQNVVGINEAELMEQWNDANDAAAAAEAATAAPAPVAPTETRNFWQGHRFLNFLLACMVFAFVISWLFHFNVPS